MYIYLYINIYTHTTTLQNPHDKDTARDNNLNCSLFTVYLISVSWMVFEITILKTLICFYTIQLQGQIK